MNDEKAKKLPISPADIFSIEEDDRFLDLAIQVFNFQYENNALYQSYCKLLDTAPEEVKKLEDIPFLPIQFFKQQEVKSFQGDAEVIFTSSGTSGMVSSRHFVYDLELYEMSFMEGFKRFYGEPDQYIILGLLPSYLEREGASLIYMVDRLIQESDQPLSGFYLHNYQELIQTIENAPPSTKILLIGVSYALMDLAEMKPSGMKNCIVMETGGMKGKRAELTKEELHRFLCEGLSIGQIHSEYGMTELLSQAYSKGDGLFECPPWMKVLIRHSTDPFSYTETTSGGINVIDLANVYSCSFIATEDLGRRDGEKFKVLGRLDNTDIRGCNLLVE